MTDTDRLLRDLTSDVDDATPMAEARIRAEVMRRLAPAPKPRWRRATRLVPLAGGVAAAAIAVALVVNTGDGGPSLAQRAEAAVTPPGEILAIAARFSSPTEPDSDVVMRDWTLAGDDGSLRMRRFISSLPVGREPDDEDSVVELDAAGNIARAVSWTPVDRLRVGLERGSVPYANSWVGILRNAYRDGSLRDAGTENGVRVLTGDLGAFTPGAVAGCRAEERVGLDAGSFEPRWFVVVETCGGKAPVETGRVTFTVERLPATAANLALLEIGPWTVKEAVRVTPDGRETPIPVAEARREAGMD